MKDKHILNPVDVFLAVFIGFILTMVFNYQLIIRYILRNDQNVINQLNNDAIEKTQGFIELIESNLSATVFTVLLWAGVYMIGYTIVYFIYQESKAAKDGAIVSKFYLRPRNYKKSEFWASSLLYVVYPFIVVCFAVVWFIVSIGYLLPFTSTVLLIALYENLSIFSSILLVASSVAIMSLVVIGFIVIFKLLRTIAKFIW